MSKLLIQCLFLIVWFEQLSSEVYSDRPRISTDDGNLIIESAYDKNVYLRAKGPKATIYIGTINVLDINITSGSRTSMPSSQEEIDKFMNGANGILKRLDAIEQSVPRERDAPYSDLFLNVSLLWRKFKTLRTNVVNLQNSIDRRFNNDDCKSNPCEHGGTCLNLLNGFHCLCPSNWEGKHCDMDVNECRNFAGTDLGCQNGATCINRQGSYECLCRSGWYGLHCTRKLKDCSGGDYEMCGHGICIPVPNGAEGIKCICDQGWTTNATGSACLTDVNECEVSQGPRCSVNPKVECINLPGTFACGQCPPGYEGDGHICSDINECLITPNGGCSTMPMVACHNTIGSRICGPCPPGYQGDGITCSWRGSCSINRGGCHPSAQCIENPAFGGQRSQCVCPAGMFGDGIGLHGCYISTNDNFTLGCDSSPCGDHGQCHTLASGYTCVCFRGFSGAHCDVPTDNCAINHCRNGGTCRPDDNVERGFRCECTAQYSGPLCQLISKTCGGVLDAEEGSIIYPMSNTTYNHNARCAWIIHTDLDKVINVTFSKFNLEENSECIYDFLQIHDGRSSASQLIGRFCGKNYPKGGNIISSFNNLYFWFRSDQSIAKDGFALHWTSIKPICGGEVNATIHGHISSPGSPGNYPPNRDCYWQLTTSYGKRIQLHFFEFDIESHPNCSFDYLEIFDGEHVTDPLISKYCNSTQPAPIESAGSDILMHFHSDAYGSGKGFQISYAPVGGVPGCGGYYTQDRGEIASPSFNGKYLNNLICEYKIKTSPDTQIRINFISFKLEKAFKCRYDYLKVYDGPSVESPLVGRFCGSTYPKTYTSTSNNIFIKFKSDITTSYEGFKLTYETVCLQTLTGDSGIIKSPGYPFNYPENRVCEYVIVTTPGKAISLSFQDFNIEDNRYFNCQYDNVEIRDGPTINSTLLGRYCGSNNIPPPLVSTHNYLYIRFKSDISVSGTGFYANYTTIDTICGGIYKANTGIINHPKEGADVYGDEEFCQWMLIAPEGMRIKLSFTRFSLESMPSCHSDYLELIEIDDNNKNETIGKFCGENKPPALTTSTNRLLMQFKSDSSVKLPGFSVSYTFLDERTNCGGIYIKSHGFIYSPGWPKRYEPNRDCSWTVRVPYGQQIKLNITEFDLERPIRNKCDHGDYLEIRNGGSVTSPLIGRYCGKFKQKTITSTTNIIYLRFHSDFYLTGNGFKIEWDGSLIGCGGTLTSSSGSISSPNYPQSYYDNAECFYRIVTSGGSKIHITFEDLQLELTNNCRDDYIEIFDGRDSSADRLGKLCQLSPKTNSIYTSSNYAYIKFRSDFFIGGKGFLLHYETVCQNNITGSYGIIESPDYPNNYPRLLNCLWTINVPKGNKIKISFRNFDIYAPTYPAWRRIDRAIPLVGSTVASVADCDIDFLQLKESVDSSFGHKLCGSIAPRTFTSKSNSVQIKFVTASFTSHSGFRIEWVKHGCGGNIQKRYGSISVDRNLTSSGAIECEWLIESELGTKVNLIVTDLNMMESMNCTTDAIEIYNGQNTASPLITKICHRGRSTISTTTNIMLIKFIKNSSLRDVYFKSIFDSFNVGSCGGKIEAHSGIIYSPNYPKKNYDSNLDCLWWLNVPKGHRIELNFVDIDLYSDNQNDCDDYINIYEDEYYITSNYTHRICPYSSVSQIISKGHILILQFKTNSYGTAKGFKANFTMVCGAIIQARYDGIISNEKYLSFSNRSCTWTILAPKPDQKISLTITYMSLPKSNNIVTNRNCPSSFLRVLDGDDENAPLVDEYCGRKIPPTIVSHGSALTVQFGTYADIIAGKFFAHYTAITTFCGGTLTSEEGSIASPNYPQSYPVSTSCEWILSTSPGNKVYVTFENFDIEYSEQCNDDYLEIRENSSIGKLLGVYCGNQIPTNSTAAARLFIKFHSNNKNTRQGFLIHYGFLHGNEITGESGEIASPLFPLQYDGSGEYTWRIFTPSSSKITISVNRLEIPVYNSVCNNGLIFYDGYDDEAPILEEICGLPSEDKRIIQTTTNSVYIKLKLDETNSGSLFHLSWKKSDSSVEENNLEEEINCGSNENNLVLPGQTKTIESPNYPNEYDDGLNCEWIFKTTFDHHLKLIFRNFQLEQTPNCFADYISVFSSNTGLEWQPIRKHICIIEKLNEVINSSTYMKVAFRSDTSITQKGFHGEVVSMCGGTIYNSSGVIGPTWFDWQNFLRDDEIRCEWSVKVRPGRVVKLDFEKFNITNRADICNIYVVLRNGDSIESPLLGNGKYCGYSHENRNDLKTSSNYLYISYINNVRSPGLFQSFRLRFEEKGVECGVTSTLDTDHTWEIISSPNYPSVPYPYSECVWMFTGPPGEILRIDFIDRFDLKTVSECSLEFVEVRDGASAFAPLKGRYCGKNPGSVKTTSNMVYIRYVTQLSEPNNGFKANVSIDICGGTIVASTGELSSPNYPHFNAIKPGSVCEWKIIGTPGQVFKIKAQDIDLPESQTPCGTKIRIEETMKLNNTISILKTFCETDDDDKDLIIETFSNEVTFKLFVGNPGWDSSAEKRGFRFTFNSSRSVCGGVITASEGYLTTPGYPRETQLRYCQWLITVPDKTRRIQVELLDAELGIDKHRIGIYNDLKFQSAIINMPSKNETLNQQVFESSGNKLAVYLWLSPLATQHRFKARFSSNEPALCGGSLSGYSGELTSPDIKRSYTCEWHYNGLDLASDNNYEYKTIYVTVSVNSSVEKKRCRFIDSQLQIKSIDEYSFNKAICGILQISLRIPVTGMDIKAIQGADSSLQFNLKWKLQPCGGVINVEENPVNILNVPTSYNESLDCIWTVKIPYRVQVEIKLEGKFQLSCEDEFITIGITSTSLTMGHYCKDKLQDEPLIVPHQTRYIQYHSAVKVNTTVKLIAKIVQNNQCGGLLTVFENTFSSPNYPKDYNSNEECAWELQTDLGRRISLTFVNRFVIEVTPNCTKDMIIIYDWRDDAYFEVARLCGRNVPPIYNSTYNKMKVVFRTDSDTELDGFRAQWTTVCGGKYMANDKEQILYSPGYPSAYSPNLNCNYEILSASANKIIVKFLDFELEGTPPSCEYDNVTVDYTDTNYYVSDDHNVYCGNELPAEIRGATKIEIRFKTDVYLQRKGFKLSYSTFTCGGQVKDPMILSTEPLGFYDDNLNCTWFIEAPINKIVVLKLIYIDLESHYGCLNDYLSIYNGLSINEHQRLALLCGKVNKTTVFRSSNNTMLLQFVSDASVHYKGYKAEVSFSYSESVGCGGEITLTSSDYTLKSPYILSDAVYENYLDCHWIIRAPTDHVIKLDFSMFHIASCKDVNQTALGFSHCDCDYVEVIDGINPNSLVIGRYCGHTAPPQITSTRNLISVRFVTDGEIVSHGFEARLISQESLCGKTLFEVTRNLQTLKSPNYGSIARGLHCSYHFKSIEEYSAIHVIIKNLDVEGEDKEMNRCNKDRLLIINNKANINATVGKDFILNHQSDAFYTHAYFYDETLRFPEQFELCGTKKSIDFYFYGDITFNILTSPDSNLALHKGFEIEINYLGNCGRNYTEPQGRLQSTYDYTNVKEAEDCYTLITAPENHTISLYFITIYPDYWNDQVYLEIFDGNKVSSPLLIKIVSEYDDKNSIFSTGRYLLLHNRIMENNQVTFDLNYVITDKGRGCGGKMHNELGRITSPMYPDIYRKRSTCEWELETPVGTRLLLHFAVYDLGRDCDHNSLQIVDRKGTTLTYCSEQPADYTSADNYVKIVFITTLNNGGTGWVADFIGVL